MNSSHSCRVSTRQTAWGKHEFSQKNDGGRKTTAAREQGSRQVLQEEVITWEGAVVGSSYIAEGVSPMAW